MKIRQLLVVTYLMKNVLTKVKPINLKLQSVSLASLSPSMFENLELQLYAELSSVRGAVLQHGFSVDESNVLRWMCGSLSVSTQVWMFTVLRNHRLAYVLEYMTQIRIFTDIFIWKNK